MIIKPKLAIGFDTIVDEDFGLIQLVFNHYLDPSVFNIEKFKRSVPEIIKDLYTREEMNPLLSFTLPDIDRNTVDEYYKEFLDTQYSAILDNAIGTNMQNYLDLIVDSKEFDITIFCYNKTQLEFISNIDEFKSIRKVLFDKEDFSEINQIYFRYIHQSYRFKDRAGGRFYYSTIGPNLNENKNDLKSTEEMDILKKRNYIYLYDLYDFDKLNNSSSEEERIIYNGLQ